MGSRMKEDERHEKIIRGLCKLQHNRRCINCGCVGPQYVCTTFSTFICNNCSGIHREFTHRVKSISMAKFTAAEVAALQAGGNLRAKELYLQQWDPDRHPLPDSSNPEKVRDFIKAVYVDKRFSAEKPSQRTRQGDWEDLPTSGKSDSRSSLGSVPTAENSVTDRHHGNPHVSRSSDGGHREDVNFENRSSSFEGRTFGKYEASKGGNSKSDRDSWVEEHFTDEGSKTRRGLATDGSKVVSRQLNDRSRYTGEKCSDDAQSSWRSRDRPPNYKSYGNESSPPVRSVRDILGEDVPKLRIEDGGHTNVRLKSTLSLGSPVRPRRDVPTQRSASFGDGGTTTGNAAGSINGTTSVFKRANSDSLIDFSLEFCPSAAVQTSPSLATSLQSSAENITTGWASFDAFPSPAPKAEPTPVINWQPDFQQWDSTALPGRPDQTTRLAMEFVAHQPQAHSFMQSQDSQPPPNVNIQRQETSQIYLDPLFAQEAGFHTPGMHTVPMFPLGGPQCVSLGSEVGLGVSGKQLRKSKNPFDSPEEASSISTNFPSMATVQAALPTLSPNHLTDIAINPGSQQYSNMGNYLPQSYYPATLPGWSGSNPLSFISMPQMQQQPGMQAGKSDNTSNYQVGPPTFVQAYGFSGESSSQVRQTPTLGGNPFA